MFEYTNIQTQLLQFMLHTIAFNEKEVLFRPWVYMTIGFANMAFA